MWSLWCIIIIMTLTSSTSTLMLKRHQQTTQTAGWTPVPNAMQDILISINDKLQSLDTFTYTLKLARLDFSLEQLMRRLDNIESKLNRMETKFDARMEKVEEVVISKDLKEEFSNDHIVRKMENLNDKFNTKTSFLDAKMGIGMERIGNKLEVLERDMHTSSDDILEKLIRTDERHAVFENQVLEGLRNLDSRSRQISEVKMSLEKELTSKIESIQMQIPNERFEQTSRILNAMDNKIQKMQTTLNELIDINGKSRDFEISDDQLRSILNNYEIVSNASQKQTKDKMEDLTTIIHKALKLNEAKFKELDTDVEQYTKKVITGMENLWRSSDEVKSHLVSAVQQGNKTREAVRNEFTKLHQQIMPLPMIEPRLADVSLNLNKKLSELSYTVDNSFATLLVAQNTFISTCRRIQENEEQIYEVLEQVVHEMRNRSELDMQKIAANLLNHSNDVSRNLDAAMMTVLSINNETVNRIFELLMTKPHVHVHAESKCEFPNANDINSIALDAVSNGKTNLDIKASKTIEDRLDDLLPDEHNNNTGISLDYENDYQMQSEADYIEP